MAHGPVKIIRDQQGNPLRAFFVLIMRKKGVTDFIEDDEKTWIVLPSGVKRQFKNITIVDNWPVPNRPNLRVVLCRGRIGDIIPAKAGDPVVPTKAGVPVVTAGEVVVTLTNDPPGSDPIMTDTITMDVAQDDEEPE
ncbi:hypothetical protein TA3x_003830 [Tundrisphaera sp. TA3]|uniref:hypothetical protein n=1 Tax=Tundrisphaera sp. TA3 TaxID=3435775 RepID=UPI003EBCFEA0